MWRSETFAQYLQQTYDSDIWEEGGLKKKMQDIVQWSLESV